MRVLEMESFFRSMSGRRAALVVSLAFAAAVSAGCDRGPKMYQVRGHVFYKDGKAPQGGACMVRFQPAGDSSGQVRKGATGAIHADGSFELYTRQPGDGVYEGEYDATFLVRKNAMDPATSLIAPKYETANMSGYSNIKVDHNISDLKFEIEPVSAGPSG
jgi:hypothetical protein